MSRGIGVLLSLCLGALLWAQGTHPITGRRVAPVLGIGGAEWLERTERELEEEPDKALDAIGFSPGMNVADVGAGTGYFALRIARRVEPGGRVWANDIQQEMLDLLRENTKRASIHNVETRLGSATDTSLPASTMDRVILVDVYHEFSEPQKMLASIRRSLKPDGRLVLLEYRKEDPKVPIRIEHKMTVKEAKTEVEAEGFRLEKVLDVLPRQHILIFRVSVQ
jgi:ubiquinone/menaquinone biosynthesis C-methylase UbiE